MCNDNNNNDVVIRSGLLCFIYIYLGESRKLHLLSQIEHSKLWFKYLNLISVLKEMCSNVGKGLRTDQVLIVK